MGTPPINTGVASKPGVATADTDIKQPGSEKQPIFAKVKNNPLKFLPIIGGGLLLLVVIFFAISKVLGGGGSSTSVSTSSPSSDGTKASSAPAAAKAPSKQVVLTYWGLWEPKETMTEVLQKFESDHPGVLVNYVKQSPTDYRDRLQSALVSGNGPDLFRFHASWVPMLKTNLSPVPSSVMSSAEYKSTYFPVVSEQLQYKGNFVGMPLMYDSLVLFYNKDILKTANEQPPKTWAELKSLASKLTIRSGDKVSRGGLAIGNASNVEHFSDIVGLLMLQNGADLTDPSSKEAQEAVQFYTNFIKSNPVWSDELPSSTVAFARGEVAMMFAPSWRAHEVIAMNPDLEFGTVRTPKLADNETTWATYWAEGVNVQSDNKDEAWALLQYLSSEEVLKKLYSDQSQIRTFGEPYPRVDMVSSISDQYVSAVYDGAENAEGWYLNSYTHDNGLNDQLIKYYEDAINAVLEGKKIDDVMETVSLGTNQVLRQFGFVSK